MGPYSLDHYAKLIGKDLSEEKKQAMDQGVRQAAYQIIERKGATNFAIGVSTQQIHEAMSDDQNRLMTVSRPLASAYNLGDICLSIPCHMSRDGAGPAMELELSQKEHDALMRSAETLDGVYHQLDI